MARAIVAMAQYRPSYRADGVAVQGSDEDEFTMAVAAADGLLDAMSAPSLRIDGLHTVGEFPPEADEGLPEALDAAHVSVARHGTGLEGLGAALQAASRGGEGARSLVLVADRAGSASALGPACGAGALALELRGGPGLVPTGTGGRRHPTHRPPDATGWIDDAVRHAGLPASGAAGTLYFVADAAPPVLLAFWRRAQQGMGIVAGSASPRGLGPAPSMAPASWLWDLAVRADAGEWGVVAEVTPDATRFLGLRRTGPVEQRDLTLPEAAAVGGASPPATIPDSALTAVSEGAYVPRARYVENLPSRWRLVGERCAACGAVGFPPRGRCRACGKAEGLTPQALPRNGTVLASTVVAPGAHPTEFDPIVAASGAYGVVLVEMAPSVRLTFQVTDHPPTPLAIGSSVGTVLRRLYPMEGEWRYGRKATPVAERPRGA